MLRLSYFSIGVGERSTWFKEDVVRFGSSQECELCLAAPFSQSLAPVQGRFEKEGERYFVVSTDRKHGLWLNGNRIQREEIKGGERVRLGSADGLELRVLEVRELQSTRGVSASLAEDGEGATQLFDVDLSDSYRPPPPKIIIQPARPPPLPGRIPTTIPIPALSNGQRKSQGLRLGEEPEPTLVSRLTHGMQAALKRLGKPHEEVQQWLTRAEKDISRARERSQGRSSGNTMIIMAQALTGIRQTAEGRARKWRRLLAFALSVALLVVLGLSGVVWFQQKRIAQMVNEKIALDQQIEAVFAEMATETDEAKLAQLEARQLQLMGRAADKLIQVKRVNPSEAAALAKPIDPLEQDIRKLLKAFNAETYAIPPIFKEVMQKEVEELRSNKAIQRAYTRKLRYWPKVQRALEKRELPEELGYITYTESRFDPTAVSVKGASGMWQLMEETARACGITVTQELDERFDPGRSSVAAACYLSKLLVEFGQESFMLVLASYNRGESGVRHALHKVAKEPGGYKKRDFWHLYRMKLLPDETRIYVPKVLAAAIVFGNPEKYGVVGEKE